MFRNGFLSSKAKRLVNRRHNGEDALFKRIKSTFAAQRCLLGRVLLPAQPDANSEVPALLLSNSLFGEIAAHSQATSRFSVK